MVDSSAACANERPLGYIRGTRPDDMGGSNMRASTRTRAASAAALFIAIAWAAWPASAAESCDQACLERIAEQYLAAMVAHDPGKAPIVQGTRYTENGVELTLPDGLWRTADSLSK